MIADDELAGIRALTFRILDRERGNKELDLDDASLAKADPILEWYLSIYDQPFGALTVEDINRICSQGWEREYFIPLALLRLQDNPFLGFYYDGSLLLSLAETPEQFWHEHPNYQETLCEIVEKAVSLLRLDEGLDPKYMESFPEVYIGKRTEGEILDLQRKVCSPRKRSESEPIYSWHPDGVMGSSVSGDAHKAGRMLR